jgi:segregation and condensation protein B
MSYDNIKAVIEALLFASEKPLTLEQIKNVLDSLDTPEVRRLLSEMQAEYESANRGVRIIEIAQGFRMVTAAALAPFLKKLYKQRRVERLSRPALETLAIIAYKQPVTKLEIESIRNVNVDGVMQSLLEKDIIRVAGRKKAPGRPKVYGTTRQFLEYFGLKSLEDLPKIGGLTVPEDKKEEALLKEEIPNAATETA